MIDYYTDLYKTLRSLTSLPPDRRYNIPLRKPLGTYSLLPNQWPEGSKIKIPLLCLNCKKYKFKQEIIYEGLYPSPTCTIMRDTILSLPLETFISKCIAELYSYLQSALKDSFKYLNVKRKRSLKGWENIAVIGCTNGIKSSIALLDIVVRNNYECVYPITPWGTIYFVKTGGDIKWFKYCCETSDAVYSLSQLSTLAECC